MPNRLLLPNPERAPRPRLVEGGASCPGVAWRWRVGPAALPGPAWPWAWARVRPGGWSGLPWPQEKSQLFHLRELC